MYWIVIVKLSHRTVVWTRWRLETVRPGMTERRLIFKSDPMERCGGICEARFTRVVYVRHHIRQKQVPNSVKAAILARWFPPRTVTRAVWRKAIKLHVSGDVLLFSESGSSLVHHYWVFGHNAAQHPFVKSLWLDFGASSNTQRLKPDGSLIV